jgi:hypothetical protein
LLRIAASSDRLDPNLIALFSIMEAVTGKMVIFVIILDVSAIVCCQSLGGPKVYIKPSLSPIKSILLAMLGEESIMFIVGNFHVCVPVTISIP